jgi:cobalt-zinc-cadmium resistance protein CzcA
LSYEQRRKYNYFFLEAVRLKQKGEYDAAFELYKHCLDIYPGSAPALYEISHTVIKTVNGIPVLIKDVAEARIGSAVRYGALTYNGDKEAVGGIVMMLKGENSAEVVSRVKEKMLTIQKSLPADIIVEPFVDRTNLIDRAIRTVETNLVEGALIVILVLVLFLGNFRAGLIVASAIPLSLLFALGMMNVFGVSANLMSLGAIDFGLILLSK